MIQVTDEMVQAARRKLPARWSMQDLHDAISAALGAMPVSELEFDISDREFTQDDLDRFLTKLHGPFHALSGKCTVEPHVTAGGLIGGGIVDAPGSSNEIPVHRPQPHPALDRPLVLGGITEIATRLDAARSTVVGWTKRAEKIGMPGPLAPLAAGPVYDLLAVEAWYRSWKDGADGDG